MVEVNGKLQTIYYLCNIAAIITKNRDYLTEIITEWLSCAVGTSGNAVYRDYIIMYWSRSCTGAKLNHHVCCIEKRNSNVKSAKKCLPVSQLVNCHLVVVVIRPRIEQLNYIGTIYNSFVTIS